MTAATAPSDHGGRAPDRPTVLIIEDEPPIVRLLAGYLERDGYRVEFATDGQEGLERALHRRPALVILDLMLPGLDGFEVTRRLRAVSGVPILMLTARDEETDRVLGLGLGADDYVTKPFSPREVVARVQAILRRIQSDEDNAFRIGRFTVDPAGRRLWRDGHELSLTALEFDLFLALVGRPGTVLTRPQLIDRVWGPDHVGDERLVDVHISRLRHKLAPTPGDPDPIVTVRGVGYRLEAQ